jgi:uncharacterized membrane protein YhaH (DUF805 family)
MEYTHTKTEHGEPAPDPSIFEDQYYKEVQEDIFRTESRKTRNNILTVGGVLLAGDLIALSVAGALNGTMLIMSMFFPLIYFFMGMLAMKQPFVAALISAAVFALIIIISLVSFGAIALVQGLIVKGIVIALLVNAVRRGKEAQNAKKNMESPYSVSA